MADDMQVSMRPGKIFHGGDRFAWPVATPESVTMDAGKIADAVAIAADYNTDSLLILRHGKLVHEQYWNDKLASDLQQTYSGTKSLFSLLVGRMIRRGYIERFDQNVRDFIPEMPAEQSQLTFHNILAMMPGTLNVTIDVEGAGAKGITQLETALTREVVAPPFTRFSYNNSAYRLLFTALERASGKSLEDLTEEEIFTPLSFADGTHWVLNYAASPGRDDMFIGYQSIKMTPTDFAKSAQIILEQGKWQGVEYVDADYANNLIRVQALEINPSFALFHHVNGDAFCRMDGPRVPHKLIPGTPDDTFLMYGARGQVVAGIPSLGLVIVRTGDHGETFYEKNNFIARMLGRIAESVSV
jgi:CubicO group peptidase (beta-lactamase class C family)